MNNTVNRLKKEMSIAKSKIDDLSAKLVDLNIISSAIDPMKSMSTEYPYCRKTVTQKQLDPAANKSVDIHNTKKQPPSQHPSTLKYKKATIKPIKTYASK